MSCQQITTHIFESLHNCIVKDLFPIVLDYLGNYFHYSSTLRISIDSYQFTVHSNRVYLLEMNNNISVFDFSGKYLETWKGLDYYTSMTIFNNKIYLSSYGDITVLNLSGVPLYSWKVSESKIRIHELCSFGRELFVLNREKFRIDVFDEKDQHLRTIEIPIKARFFTITKNHIICSFLGEDDVSSSIHILDHCGRQINHFCCKHYLYPTVVGDEIYIGNDREIMVYSFQGKPLRMYPAGYLKYFAVFKDRLYVANLDEFRIYNLAPDVLP